MAKFKATLYVHTPWLSETEPYIAHCDLSEYGHALMGTVDVEFDFEMPSRAEQVRCEVQLLEKEKQKVQAEAHKKVAELQDRIDSMLCLENIT